MATSDVIARMTARPGQSQPDRAAPELDPASAPIEERGGAELLRFLARFAEHVHFYAPPDAQHEKAWRDGDWSPFFAEVAEAGELENLLASERANLPPHLALLLAFLDMYEYPRRALNAVTGRHLEFFFEKALGFTRRAAAPDRAHVVFELKRGAQPLRVRPEDEIFGGKDDAKREIVFSPAYDAIVGRARVESLRGVLVDALGATRAAHIANSGDGAGAPLSGADAAWPAFGNEQWPRAEIGFAVASPLLRMRDGTRRITLQADRYGVPLALGAEEQAAAYVTGEKGWLGPFPVRNNNGFEFDVPDSELAIVDWTQKVHGGDYRANSPAARVAFEKRDLSLVREFTGVTVKVARTGATDLTVTSSLGSHDPTKAFQPFGASAPEGASFELGHEAFSNWLSRIKVVPEWLGPTPSFELHYWQYRRAGKKPFEADLALPGATLSPSSGALFDALAATVSEGAAQPRDRRLAITLRGDFGHAEYRTLVMERAQSAAPVSVEKLLPKGQKIQGFAGTVPSLFEAIAYAVAQYASELHAPFTPTIKRITLDYDASSFDASLFHVGAFGVERIVPFGNTPTSLLPWYRPDGEFLIGLAGAAANGSVDLLLQTAEGSADPDAPAPSIRWSVLTRVGWRDFEPHEIARDTTNRLRRSGVVGFVLPATTSTEHTQMPSGLVWLRASLEGSRSAVCSLVGVHANGVECIYRGPADAERLAGGALPAGKLVKLKRPLPAIAKLAQPYASFGGRARESKPQLYRRASERLRHRGRCVTAWDYERLVLEEFPGLHRVKCIPHAKPGAWLAPGHVLLVVVPDLRNRGARDLLRPRVDADTLSAIQALVRSRAREGVQVTVSNPSYREVKLSFKVNFSDGLGFDAYRAILERELIELLTPWAHASSADVTFGGALYRSRLLRFVEERAYVDNVSDFELQPDAPLLRASAPDEVLVSAEEHAIVNARPSR